MNNENAIQEILDEKLSWVTTLARIMIFSHLIISLLVVICIILFIIILIKKCKKVS